MRRGTKRKTTHKKGASEEPPVEEAKSNEASQSAQEQPKDGASEPVPEENHAEKPAEEEPSKKAEEEPSKRAEEEPSKKAVEPSKRAGRGRAKRARISKPEAEPEYFPEQRNLEDLWKQAFPVGTEWDQLDAVYQYNWNFSNLEDAFEEGGKLYNKRVYLFGCTEAQLVNFKDQSKLTLIPVMVAIVSPFPPSDKIGIKSVQRENEEIVPMKRMKMDWVPYIPLERRGAQVERLKKSQIFILSCTQRRAGLKHMKEESVMKFQYCLPYFYHPFQEDEVEQSTIVEILFPAENKPVFCEFDWELDELEEFTDKLIEEEELSADQKDAFKEFVKEKVREGKRANREAREARKKALEEMSEETKTAFQNMTFYKFYPVPTPDSPDVSNFKSSFINRYYGKAHEVL